MNSSKSQQSSCRQCRKAISMLLAAAAVLMSPESFANYGCSGLVSYLGIDQGGDVVVALANSTPMHKICNVITQGNYGMSAPSCKIAYAAFLTARLAGKSMVVYYNDNGLACGTLPSWGQVPAVYFVQGPD